MRKEDFVTKNTKIKTNIKLIDFFIKTKVFIVIKNWVFQGFFDLSYQEKIYKVFIDIVITCGILLIFKTSIISVLISFFISHTINWITNDHFVDNLFHLEFIHMTPKKMQDSILFFKKQINSKDFICYGGIYGRISRGEEVRKGTDIDIRLLKKEGFINSVNTCFFGHYLRFISLLKLIPIDLNIWNNSEDLKRMRLDENPLILKDTVLARDMYKDLDILLLEKYYKFDIRY